MGDAVVEQSFADVSAGHVFRDAIACVAYYGITRGAGDGSMYSPGRDVSRAEMAVFVARAAEAAGMHLGGGVARFDDIDGIWAEARDAVNRLASSGVIASGGAFGPGDAITRAEMASFLVGLLAKSAPNVVRDSAGAVLLGVSGFRSVADARFADTDNREVAALYELGVATGAAAAVVQDRDELPLDFNYEPGGTVDRGEMAAFVTRALAHTSVRPVGVSAQFDGADVVVSVRDDSFRPVPGAAVDVFWAAADRADRAVPAGGPCILGEVVGADVSLFACEIDGTDPVTGEGGDAAVAVIGLRRVPAGGAAVWAWTGSDGDTVAAGADPYRLDVAEGDDVGFASEALVATAFNARRARIGGSVLYTMQLRDIVGPVSAGVDGTYPARWTLSVRTQGVTDPELRTLESGGTGAVAFTVGLAARPAGVSGGDVAVTYTLTPEHNAPSAVVSADGRGAATGRVIFSDAPSSIDPGVATVFVETRDYVHVADGSASNAATVTVLDQYGVAFPGARASLASSLTANRVTLDTGEHPVGGRGSHRFAYQYPGSGDVTETLTASYSAATGGTPGTETATVYWAADAGPSHDGGTVLLAYDDNDRFNLRGSPATVAVFESELADALARGGPTGLSLAWSNYRPGSDRRVTEYSLD